MSSLGSSVACLAQALMKTKENLKMQGKAGEEEWIRGEGISTGAWKCETPGFSAQNPDLHSETPSPRQAPFATPAFGSAKPPATHFPAEPADDSLY